MKRITAGKSILENTKTGCVFIADRIAEQTQCIGENRDHIIWVGELDVAIPDTTKLMRDLYEYLKPDDEIGQIFMKNKIELFIELRGL